MVTSRHFCGSANPLAVATQRSRPRGVTSRQNADTRGKDFMRAAHVNGFARHSAHFLRGLQGPAQLNHGARHIGPPSSTLLAWAIKPATYSGNQSPAYRVASYAPTIARALLVLHRVGANRPLPAESVCKPKFHQGGWISWASGVTPASDMTDEGGGGYIPSESPATLQH